MHAIPIEFDCFFAGFVVGEVVSGGDMEPGGAEGVAVADYKEGMEVFGDWRGNRGIPFWAYLYFRHHLGT